MSIVPLTKVTIYGPSGEKDAVLDGLQRLGCLHLNDLRSGAATTAHITAPDADARAAAGRVTTKGATGPVWLCSPLFPQDIIHPSSRAPALVRRRPRAAP